MGNHKTKVVYAIPGGMLYLFQGVDGKYVVRERVNGVIIAEHVFPEAGNRMGDNSKCMRMLAKEKGYKGK